VGRTAPGARGRRDPARYNDQGFTEHYVSGQLDVAGIMDSWRATRRAAGEKVSYQHEAGAGGYVYATVEDGEPVINFLYEDESEHVPLHRLVVALDITLNIQWEELPEEERPVVLTNQDLLERLMNLTPAQRQSHLVWAWRAGQGRRVHRHRQHQPGTRRRRRPVGHRRPALNPSLSGMPDTAPPTHRKGTPS
jgi:hypothetical protein